MTLPLAVSGGDPAGIGLEIALKAWLLRGTVGVPPFFILADPVALQDRISLLGVDVPISIVEPDQAWTQFRGALPVIPLNNKQEVEVGRPSYKNAMGIIEAIERGAKLVNDGLASALVTCPIAKNVLYDAGFKFPGHTEFLADIAFKMTGSSFQPVMMLAGSKLRTIPVTIHIALEKVPLQLTTELIVRTALIAYNDLRDRFAIKNPRLAIAGLNPHAGEGGAMGYEEENIIMPAVKILRDNGLTVTDPLPSDTMFNERARKNYDVALCMYHDQALIPVKTIGFDDTVNVTLGLPFVRTSPDHGTAFDIAAKGIASPDSFIASLKLAELLAENSCNR